ncbi:MAG: ATP-binding protein [Steroidobacteraceae bacterium]
MSALPELTDRDSLAPSRDARTADRSHLLHRVLGFAVFQVAFYFAYRYGMAFSQASASPFWFPDSVLLCTLLLVPPRWWALYVLSVLPIRLFSDVAPEVPLWFLMGTFLIDSTRAVLTALALRHFMKNPLRLDTLRDFAVYCLFAVLLIPAVGALGGATARHTLGHDFWTTWEQWFLGDALAHLVVTPAILYWIVGAFRARTWRPVISRDQAIEVTLLSVGLVVTSYIAANTGGGSVDLLQTRFYAPVPFMFWAAIRFGMLGASGAVVVTAVMRLHAVLHGESSLAQLSPAETAFALQNFLLLRAGPLYLVAVLVEQRRNAERLLRESEERFRTIADTTPALIWFCDRNRVFFNQSWLQFTGRTLEQEVRSRGAESVHPDDQSRVRSAYSGSLAYEQVEMEFRLRRYDGEYRYMLNKSVPRYAPNGEFLGCIGSVVDITDRKRAEEVDRALAHAQRLAAMGELTALIAHEVRQPLSAILLNADTARALLQKEAPPLDQLREIIDDIRRDDLLAEETIRRLRAFLRDQEPLREPLDINAAVTDVLRLVSSDASRRHMRMRVELEPGLPPVVGDRTQLQQVLLNLVINAMDAQADTPQGARHITVRTKPNGNEDIEVIVQDRGCGISPETLPRLFLPFFTTSQSGIGLGLSIARSVVVAHGGKIWAENNVDGGATFHFTIPQHRSVG